jgi:hypothetical protein
MKRAFIVVLILVSGSVFGQEFSFEYIDVRVIFCILHLGEPLPDSYLRFGKNQYGIKDGMGSIVFYGEDNIVIESIIGAAFEFVHEGYLYLANFHNYFERAGWAYENADDIDIYTKNGIKAIIYSPEKRSDGLIIARVVFRAF